MDEMVETTNHSIKQVTVTGAGVVNWREEEPLVFDMETDQEHNKVLNFVTTEEVIEKSTTAVVARLFLVPELKETDVEEAVGEK